MMLICIIVYFLVLFGVSFLVGKDIQNSTFFMANRNSPWYVVAFGMLGASISGISFISVPGLVLTSGFSYMQMVFGFIFGYLIIAWVLLPLYYKLQLTTIYAYLNVRFGSYAYKTGAAYFLLSKMLATAPILYVVVVVIQKTIADSYHISFPITVFFMIGLIWLYTFRSGLKTIVWTDVLQTFFMLLSILLTIYAIAHALNFSFRDTLKQIVDSKYTSIFEFKHFKNGNYFWKMFLAGVFIPIVMTGLDQDKMQKNLTCRTLREAQKNIVFSGLAFTPINLLFLSLGVLLTLFSSAHGIAIPSKADTLFPSIINMGLLPPYIGIVFILGLVAATYSSADSALAAMTTSFCVDFLHLKQDSSHNQRIRLWVHLSLSIVLALVVIGIKMLNLSSIINALYQIVSYTYGPLLGLFAFGLFTSYQTKDWYIPFVATGSIILSWFIQFLCNYYFSYKVGYELLVVNGLITFVGLYLLRNTKKIRHEY